MRVSASLEHLANKEHVSKRAMWQEPGTWVLVLFVSLITLSAASSSRITFASLTCACYLYPISARRRSRCLALRAACLAKHSHG